MSLKPRTKRITLWSLAGLVVVIAAVGVKLRLDGFFRAPVYELDSPIVPALPGPAILVFSKTNGFIHKEAIPTAQQLFQQIGKSRGWSVYQTDNAAIHNSKDLARFSAVIWNNVSGDVLTIPQRDALQAYVQGGGGFVGLHGAGGDPHYDWHWYPQELIRAQFTMHPMFPQFQTATLQVESPQDPIVSHLEHRFTMEDEWYSFQAPPKNVEVLLSLDEQTYTPTFLLRSLRMGADHPIAWKHCLGQGRVLYSAIGHQASTYQDARYARMLEMGTAWAMQPGARACK